MIRLGITFTQGGVTERSHLGDVSKRSPFQPGDRVQLHGYPGAYPGQEQYGFRGFVLGGFGANLLRGLTDEGAEWVVPAGWLVRDGESDGGASWCVCCPHPERLARRPARTESKPRTSVPAPECLRPYLPAERPLVVQPSLFEVAA